VLVLYVGPNVFLLYSSRLSGCNENYRYRYPSQKMLTHKRRARQSSCRLLFRAFNIPSVVFTTLKSNAKNSSSKQFVY